MNREKPPRLANWMLEYFLPSYWNEALAGDLLEGYRSGRSRRWYWYQVFTAIGNGLLRSVRSRCNAIAFAGFWCMLAPAWFVVAVRIEARFANANDIWRLMWPWSIICSSVLSVAPGLIFVWAGLALYQAPGILLVRRLRILRLGRRILAAAVAFIAISMGIAWLVTLFPPAHRPDWSGPVLSLKPDAPFFARKMVGGGRDVTVVRGKDGTIAVHTETRVYIVPHSFWEAYRIDNSPSAVPPATAIAAIEEFGIFSDFNRLVFFCCLLIATWSQSPQQREGFQ